MSLHCPDSMATVARFFNSLSPDKLQSLGDVYAPGVEFHDPLHHTRGLAQLRQVYERMFAQLTGVEVVVSDTHGDDETGFMLWKMQYKLRGKERIIQGTSHLRFAPDGRVAVQRDFWDASFPVYGEAPLLGWAMRRIRNQTGITPQPR